MNNFPDVSVVMCCYNSEHYIKETIDSVLAQTFDNFEFIIWNDGSTDSTKVIIESYQDGRIRLFSDINRGEGKAAQLACEQVKGRYIARIDSDDIWLPTKLEEEFLYMEKHPEIALVSCPLIFIDQNNNELGQTFPVTNVIFLTKSILKENRFVHSGSLYRSDIYRKTGGYDDVRYFQDWLLFRKISDYGLLALMPKPLIKYRLLPNSVAHRMIKSPYLNILNALKMKIVKDRGLVKEDLKLYNAVYNLLSKDSVDNELIFKRDLQNNIYLFFSKIMGHDYSYKLMIAFMNLYAKFMMLFK